MTKKDWFIHGVAVALFIFAAWEILCAIQLAPLLDRPDALLFLPLRGLLYGLAAIKLALSAYLLLGRDRNLKLMLILWMAFNVMIYRVGAQMADAPFAMNCLGNMSDDIPVRPRILDAIVLVLFGAFFVTSAALLVRDWLKDRQPSAVPVAAVVTEEQSAAM